MDYQPRPRIEGEIEETGESQSQGMDNKVSESDGYGERTATTILIDNSHSMTHKSGGRTRFETVRIGINDILDDLRKDPNAKNNFVSIFWFNRVLKVIELLVSTIDINDITTMVYNPNSITNNHNGKRTYVYKSIIEANKTVKDEIKARGLKNVHHQFVILTDGEDNDINHTSKEVHHLWTKTDPDCQSIYMSVHDRARIEKDATEMGFKKWIAVNLDEKDNGPDDMVDIDLLSNLMGPPVLRRSETETSFPPHHNLIPPSTRLMRAATTPATPAFIQLQRTLSRDSESNPIRRLSFDLALLDIHNKFPSLPMEDL